jgi:hypothetical protein
LTAHFQRAHPERLGGVARRDRRLGRRERRALARPLKPIPPALDHAITAPSGSVMVIVVLLKLAWMCAYPWWMTRFSPRFLNVFFLGLPAAFLPPGPSGWTEASMVSIFAMC